MARRADNTLSNLPGYKMCSSCDNSASQSTPDFRIEYENLKRAYDELKREKEALAAKYNADYQKWRKFKHWLLSQDSKPTKFHHATASISNRPLREVDRRVAEGGEKQEGSSYVAEPSTPKAVLQTKNIGSPSNAFKRQSLSPEIPFILDDSPERDLEPEKQSPVAKESLNVTINSRYRLKAKENDGVDYQFQEVVRNKEERKRLHGTACECCQDYYAAVGPLPSRAQAPLWRTPVSTPKKRRRTEKTSVSDDEEVDEELAHHVHEISRHRDRWEAPATPPGYWDISFPDTQEAAAINLRARDMHVQKMRRIEAEARRGGRYEKR